jgi:putative peptidoglycan lipid II flippase
VLGTPIVQLIFQRGAFLPADTTAVVLALNIYLIGLIPASLDWTLNYTFYARNDTLTPAIVGVASVGIYLFFALLLVRPYGFLGLVFADSMKHTGHFILMWILLRRRLGDLRDLRAGATALRTLAASAVMAVVLLLLLAVMQPRLPAGFAGNLVLVTLAGVLGAAVYLLTVSRLGVQEAGMVVERFSRRLRAR